MPHSIIYKDGSEWRFANTFLTIAAARGKARAMIASSVKGRIIRDGRREAEARCANWNAWIAAKRTTPEYREYVRIQRDLRQ